MKKRPYYSHDVDARNDERIVRARIKHGAAGYSVYFMILEIMRNHPEYICETDYEVIAFDVREPVEVVKSVVEDFRCNRQKKDKTVEEFLKWRKERGQAVKTSD